jgi:integrase
MSPIKPNRPPAVSPIRGSKSWGCKVKLPDNSRYAVSLRVPWPGNVGRAKDRAAELQREVDARQLVATLQWLGDKAVETLRRRLGLQAVDREDAIGPLAADPTTWWEARAAWLATYPAQATVAGKVCDPDLTRRGYESKTRSFCRWADEVKLKFGAGAKSATTIARLYLRAREAGGTAACKKGVSKGSLDHDIRVLHTWFGWLRRRGWSDQLDKELVYEEPAYAEARSGGINFTPDWRLDLATLEKMHAGRFEDEAAFMAWRLYVLVRGLGCRPKEAFTLAWDTIQLEEGLVTFKDVKEEKLKAPRRGRPRRSLRTVRDRPVPIIWQWVQDALEEMKALGAGHGRAVATNTEDTHHKGTGQVANAFARRLKALGLYRAGYGLKACQRAALIHLEQVLPPWVVARLAGHGMGIHEAHYSNNRSHLPELGDRDLGRFDVLSAAGTAMVAHHQQSTYIRELLERGKL